MGWFVITNLIGQTPYPSYLIFEKSSLKNQVRQTEFLMQKSILKLIFAVYTGSKNPV